MSSLAGRALLGASGACRKKRDVVKGLRLRRLYASSSPCSPALPSSGLPLLALLLTPPLPAKCGPWPIHQRPAFVPSYHHALLSFYAFGSRFSALLCTCRDTRATPMAAINDQIRLAPIFSPLRTHASAKLLTRPASASRIFQWFSKILLGPAK